MRILGIAGSLRRGSHNRKLLRAAGRALPPGAELVEWEGLGSLPIFDEDLVNDPPAVVQDFTSGEVLMVGFMNQDAWDITKRTGYVTFYSRTRNTLWTKGETSGNKLAVRDVLIDCDEDTVLVKAERLGGGNVCHTGERTCFFQRAEGVTIP